MVRIEIAEIQATDSGEVTQTVEFDPEIVSFPLKIGSGSDADISLATDGSLVGLLHAELVEFKKWRKKYSRWKLTFTPNWRPDLQEEEAEFGVPVEIDVGNSLEFGNWTVEILDVSAGDSDAAEESPSRIHRWYARIRTAIQPLFAWPKRQRFALSEELSRIRHGAREFPRITRKLACVIHESELAQIEPILNRGFRFTKIAGLGFVIACLLLLGSITADSPDLAQWAGLVAFATLILPFMCSYLNAVGTSLFLVFGGAVWAALSFSRAEQTEFYASFQLTVLLLIPIGIFLENAMCSIPRWHWSVHVGLIAAMILAALILFYPGFTGRSISSWVTVSAVAFLVWIFLVVPRRQQWFLKQLNTDAIVLITLAWTRWKRRLFARVFCVVVGLIPLLSLLHTIDMRAHFVEALESDVITSERSIDGEIEKGVWVWEERASLLTRDDLRNLKLYALDSSHWERLREFTTANKPSGFSSEKFFVVNSLPEVSEILEGSRIESEAQFRSSFEERDSEGKKDSDGNKKTLRLWELISPEEGGEGAARIVPGTAVRTNLKKIRDYIDICEMFLLPAVIVGLVGILLSWRGEGRGPLGLLIVLWAMGFVGLITIFSMIATQTGSNDGLLMHLNPLYRSLAMLDESSLLARLFPPAYMLFMLLFAVLSLGYYIWATCIPVFWTLPTGENSLFIRCLQVLFSLVPGAILLPVMLLLDPENQSLVNVFWVILLGMPTILGIFIYLYRKKKGYPNRKTSVWHLVAFTIPSVLTVLLVATLDDSKSFDRVTYQIPVILLTALLIWSLVQLILRQNMWSLGGGRTIGTVVTVMVLPLGIELADELVLRSLQSARVIPASAVAFSSVFFALLLFDPVKRVATRILRFVTLKKTQRSALNRVDKLVDTVIQCSECHERGDHLVSLLEDLEMKHYAIYSRWRRSDGAYDCLATDFSGWKPPRLRLSNRLQTQLACEISFVHIDRILHEFNYVLTGPELWRMQQTLGRYSVGNEADNSGGGDTAKRCEQILCITIGGVLCAFVVFGEQSVDEPVRNDGCVDQLRDVVVASSIPD